MLEKEKETYELNHAKLLGEHRGKFVVIKDDKIIEVFSSIDDALKHGYDLFEGEPFLVKQVTDVEVPQNFTSFHLRV